MESKTQKPPQSRLIWGGLVFVVGLLSPLAIPFVLKLEISVGLKSALTGLLAFGIPELFMLLAVAVMGKSGFNYFKRLISIIFRRYGPPDEVSPGRYKLGLILFILPLAIALVLPYIASHLEILQEYFLPIAIGGDILLLISLMVLGGDFWDKLRGLFIQKAKIQIIK